MKVFVSSVITGMEGYRAMARQAAETLGHTVTAAEDFRASPQTPQQVCLGAVRDADVAVLLLGARYGAPQESGISPTHEEYREARGTKPVLAFVQEGVTREPEQERFVEEVSTWEGGGYRESFDTPESLRSAVTRAARLGTEPAARSGERRRADGTDGRAPANPVRTCCECRPAACRGGRRSSTAIASARCSR